MKFQDFMNQMTDAAKENARIANDMREAEQIISRQNDILTKINQGKTFYDNAVKANNDLHYSSKFQNSPSSKLGLPPVTQNPFVEIIGDNWTQAQKDNYYYLLSTDAAQAKQFAREVNAYGKTSPVLANPISQSQARMEVLAKEIADLEREQKIAKENSYYSSLNGQNQGASTGFKPVDEDNEGNNRKLKIEQLKHEYNQPKNTEIFNIYKTNYKIDTNSQSWKENSVDHSGKTDEEGTQLYRADYVPGKEANSAYDAFLAYIHFKNTGTDETVYLGNGETTSRYAALSYTAENNGWNLATDDEIGILRYLINTRSKKIAYKYWEELSNVLLGRRATDKAEKVEEDYRNSGTGERIVKNIKSVPQNLFGGVMDEIVQLFYAPLDMVAGTNIAKTANAQNDLTITSSAVRGTQNEIISENYSGLSEMALKSLYNGALAAADNAFRTAVSLGNPLGQGALAGFSAAGQKSRELRERGVAEWKIGVISTAVGALEMLTEKYGLERMLESWQSENVKSFFKNWLLSLGYEGSEEIASNWGERALEGIFLGKDSKDKIRLREIMQEQQINGTEAAKKLFLEWVAEDAEAFVTAVISTVFMGAPGVVTSSYNNYAINKQVGNTYKNSVDELIQSGLESAEGTESRKLAEQYKKKVDSGKKLTNEEITRLVIANQQAIKTEQGYGAENDTDIELNAEPNISVTAEQKTALSTVPTESIRLVLEHNSGNITFDSLGITDTNVQQQLIDSGVADESGNVDRALLYSELQSRTANPDMSNPLRSTQSVLDSIDTGGLNIPSSANMGGRVKQNITLDGGNVSTGEISSTQDTESGESFLTKLSAVGKSFDVFQKAVANAVGDRATLTPDQYTLRKMGEAFGVKVEFKNLDKWLTNKEGKKYLSSPDGAYNRDTNTIYLNTSDKRHHNPVAYIIKHELTHSLENKAKYADLQNAIFESKAFKEYYKSLGFETLKDFKDDILDKYRENQVKGFEEDLDPKEVERNINYEITANFVGDVLFGGRQELTANLLQELNPEQRRTFIELIKDIFAKLKKQFSKNRKMYNEITRLEKLFLKTAKAVETKTTADNGGGMQYAVFSGSRGAENLYDTPENMKPQSEEEWSVFNRQFANKTNGLKNSEKSNIMIYTKDYAYFVSANGYMRGRIVGKISIDGNEERIKIITKEFKDGTFIFGKGTDLLAQSIRSNRGRGYRRHASLKETLAAEGYADLDGDTHSSNDRRGDTTSLKNPKQSEDLSYSLTDNERVNLSNVDEQTDTVDDSNLQFSFARSDNAKLISKAETLEKTGKSSDEIWKKTGLIRDASGIWVYEIDDSKAQVFPFGDAKLYLRNQKYKEYVTTANFWHSNNSVYQQLQKNYFFSGGVYGYKLSDFLKHDKLFKKYPELKDWEVRIEKLNGANGKCDKDNKVIYLDISLLEQFKRELHPEIENTLFHEVQHAIQSIEERANGADSEYWNARMVSGNFPYEKLHNKKYTPYEAYRNTAGEIEAHLTGERREMSAKERKKKIPDLKYGEALFVEDKPGVKYVVKKDVSGTTYIDVENYDFNEDADSYHIAKILYNMVRYTVDKDFDIRKAEKEIDAETALEWKNTKPIRYPSTKKYKGYNELLKQTRGWLQYNERNSSVKFSSFGRKTVNFKIGDNQYFADIVIGKTKNGNSLLYDILRLKEINTKESVNISEKEKSFVSASQSEDNDLKFSLPDNKSYMSAVKDNDMHTAQQMADETAEANGYTERLYHQTGADFTEFNTENQKAGKYDYQLPTGTFLKPANDDIGLSGKKQMELYAKIKNPLSFKDREAAQSFWSKNVEGYSEASETVNAIDEEYGEKFSRAEGDVRRYMLDWRKSNPDAARKDIFNDAEFQRLHDIEQSVLEEWEQRVDEASLKAKKLIDKFISESDYDGVVIERDQGSGGRFTKSYIVFNSNQLKDASPVTYDDDGNVIPLSQRFDETEADIRYSIPSNFPNSIDSYTETKSNNFYQEYLEDMPINEYNKLTVKKPIKVPKSTFAAVNSARTQLYADAKVEDIPIIDIINLGEYGVLNTNDYYFIRNADRINFSIVKHSKTLKGRKNNYDEYGNGVRPQGEGTSRLTDNSNADEGIKRKNNTSNRDNRPFAHQSTFRENANETQFVEETNRRIGDSNGSSDIGRGIRSIENNKYSFPDRDSAEALYDKIQRGEITKEQYLDEVSRNRRGNPVTIAQLPKEAANTTPNLSEPKRIGTGDKESKLYSSLLESEIITDEVKNEIANDTFIKNYGSTTNKRTLNMAVKELEEGGRERVLDFQDLGEHPEKANAVDVAVGLILLERYQRAGMTRDALKVAETLRAIGTVSGQTVQIFSIIGRFDPDMMVTYAQKELNQAFEELVKGKTQRWIDKNKDLLKLTDDEIEAIRRRTLLAATLEDGTRQKAVLLGEICAIIQDKIPAKLSDSIRALQRISLLLNPKTNIRNIVGNVSMVGVYVADDFFGNLIDKSLAKKTNVRTTGTAKFNQETLGGFKKGVYETLDDFKRGIHTKQEELNRFDIKTGQGKSFNTNHRLEALNKVAKGLNALDNFTSFCLEMGDRPFFEMWYINSLNNQMRLNNVDIPTPEMMEIAKEEALQRTWQNDSALARGASRAKKSLNDITEAVGLSIDGYGLGDVVEKFTKTPANIATAIVEYSPLGFKAAIKNGTAMKNALETGQFTPKIQKEYVNSLSRAITGTLMYTLIAALGSLGWLKLSARGDDDKDVSNFEKYIVGIPPYSVDLFGVNITYDWMQPIGSVLAVVADVMESKNDGVKNPWHQDLFSAIKAGGKAFAEQSFLRGLADLFSSEDWVDGVITALMNEPSAFISTGLSQVASFTDPYRRVTYEKGNVWQTMINKMLVKLPYFRTTLNRDVNVMGEDIENLDYSNPWRAFFAPGNRYPESSGYVAEEIYNLYQQIGDKDVFPKVAPNDFTVASRKIQFTAAEKEQFQREIGQTSVNILTELFNSKEFEKLNDEEKVRAIKAVYDYAYDKAKADFKYDYDYELLSKMVGERHGKPILTEEKYKKLDAKAKQILINEHYLSDEQIKCKGDAEKLAKLFIEKAKD